MSTILDNLVVKTYLLSSKFLIITGITTCYLLVYRYLEKIVKIQKGQKTVVLLHYLMQYYIIKSMNNMLREEFSLMSESIWSDS